MDHTLVVVDDESQLWTTAGPYQPLTFERYLADYPRKGEGRTRLINLCDTDRYLSRGYYCSLLAEARRHQVLPAVRTINSLREQASEGGELFGLRLPENVDLTSGVAGSLELFCAFGDCREEKWRNLVKRVYERYPAPLLRLLVTPGPKGLKLKITRLALNQLDAIERQFFIEHLEHFTSESWRSSAARKHHRWNMAILVNPAESNPPSDKRALRHFIHAASQVGIGAELVTAEEIGDLARYDALFIRETTAVDHHTYRIAHRAEREGLVVIDDTTSILRCCNKVFLHDAFSYQGVPSLRTEIVIDSSAATCERLAQEFGFPLVLKMPEGSFSRGVFRIETPEELPKRLMQVLEESALVLVQQYCYTDFDWRIGLIGGRALFACRYHMAHRHWQIYNHGASARRSAGGFQTLPTFEVPKTVLKAALRAGSVIGNGLYGVDLKEDGGRAYVIEVNDNPSIESDVEDGYLGKELYMLIMTEFVSRLEKRGRTR